MAIMAGTCLKKRSRQKPRFLPAAKNPGSAATFCG